MAVTAGVSSFSGNVSPDLFRLSRSCRHIHAIIATHSCAWEYSSYRLFLAEPTLFLFKAHDFQPREKENDSHTANELKLFSEIPSVLRDSQEVLIPPPTSCASLSSVSTSAQLPLYPTSVPSVTTTTVLLLAQQPRQPQLAHSEYLLCSSWQAKRDASTRLLAPRFLGDWLSTAIEKSPRGRADSRAEVFLDINKSTLMNKSIEVQAWESNEAQHTASFELVLPALKRLACLHVTVDDHIFKYPLLMPARCSKLFSSVPSLRVLSLRHTSFNSCHAPFVHMKEMLSLLSRLQVLYLVDCWMTLADLTCIAAHPQLIEITMVNLVAVDEVERYYRAADKRFKDSFPLWPLLDDSAASTYRRKRLSMLLHDSFCSQPKAPMHCHHARGLLQILHHRLNFCDYARI